MTLGAGESSVIEPTTEARLWRRWASELNRWGEPLPYGGRLLVARGLGDIRICRSGESGPLSGEPQAKSNMSGKARTTVQAQKVYTMR